MVGDESGGVHGWSISRGRGERDDGCVCVAALNLDSAAQVYMDRRWRCFALRPLRNAWLVADRATWQSGAAQ